MKSVNMCWSRNSKTLSWLGIMWGLLSLATLLTAFLSNVWLYTKEPTRLPNSEIFTTVTFKIGLWRICPTLKRTNATSHMQNLSCTSIKYSSWDEITATDLGISSSLEFTPTFLSKMRISTVFGATSIIFIFLATASAVIGLYNSDHKTIVACGLFILGGLTLGGGLLIFASVLSDVYFDRPKRTHFVTEAFDKMSSNGFFDYKYGWSFFAAGAAFFMSELAAVLTISAYVGRFPTVEDMVRAMVPGAERRLKERHSFAGPYLVQHKNKLQGQDPVTPASVTSGQDSRLKNETLNTEDFQRDEGNIFLSKPAPDICASNPATITENIISFSSTPNSSEIFVGPGGAYCIKSESSYLFDEIGSLPKDSVILSPSLRRPLAGKTVPIVLMHHSQRTSGTPFMLSMPGKDIHKNFQKSTLPLLESGKKYDSNTFPSELMPFDNNEILEYDQDFYSNQNTDFEDRISDKKKFYFNLKHLNSEARAKEANFFGTFHGEKIFTETGLLDLSSSIPRTFSTTSSSSGTGSGTTLTTESSQSCSFGKKAPIISEKKKKKSVTIGNVFNKMETFEPNRTDNDSFECRNGD